MATELPGYDTARLAGEANNLTICTFNTSVSIRVDLLTMQIYITVHAHHVFLSEQPLHCNLAGKKNIHA